MKSEAGLWIDHRKAVIVMVTDEVIAAIRDVEWIL
jgi:hypothetical protein